ncbi:hypothetical protein [Paenarthrobacter sp. 4246]|uniref:hypothetical protein n=1 Tax=Paenarthrobacter sp. 4246 TaxID=3156456 RepID=UPI0033959FF6
MNPPPTISRRSILRMFPAAAVTAAVVVLSANQATAQTPVPDHNVNPAPSSPGHRAIIGVL